MTLQELYEKAEGSYEAARKVMMMDSLIGRMIVKLPEDKTFGKLMAAGEAMDTAGLFEEAHALKGVAGSLGLTKLSALAGEITEEYRPGKPRTMSDEEVKGKLEEIRTLYERTMECIREYQM